jgi:alpha-D-ribose 1-methylphosphonate 5-triphosphate synthase subunit PhnH
MQAAFVHPVFDAQRTFRELLQATARPAIPRSLPVLPPPAAPLHESVMALLLTLCDASTSLWLQQSNPELEAHLRFHTGVRLTDTASEADFAVLTDLSDLPPLTHFSCGDPRYPDRSATLIVQVEDLRNDAGPRFAGPGIRDSERLLVEGLPNEFWAQRAALASRLPQGIDLVFVTAHRLAAVPRTTRLLEV